MKTSDLIRMLRDADPSGELEVTIGKVDIWFAQVMPCYYDGHVEILKRDPNVECYDIVGAEIRGKGSHVLIETHSIEDMLNGDPELPVTFDSEATEQRYKGHIEATRQKVRLRKSLIQSKE